MDEKQKAIKTSSKVIAVIMKIGYIAMIVEMCICAASLIFIAVTGGTSVITAGITIVAAGDELATVQGAVAMCVAAFVLGAFLFAIFLLTYRVFNEISETGTPFKTKYVKNIKTAGILIAVMSIASGIVDSIVSGYAGVETVGMSTDPSGAVFGVIVFCLAYIFDYGCMLQQQSDETL